MLLLKIIEIFKVIIILWKFFRISKSQAASEMPKDSTLENFCHVFNLPGGYELNFIFFRTEFCKSFSNCF